MKQHGLLKIGSLLFVAGLAACAGGGTTGVPGTISASVAQHDAQSPVHLDAARKPADSASAATAVQVVAAVDAGGGGVGVWKADSGEVGGWVGTSSAAVDTSQVSDPAPQAVYQTTRYGAAVSYVVGGLSPDLPYTLRLHFVEPFFTAAQQRLFNVTIGATRVLNGFDIFAAAGGRNIAVVRTFPFVADHNGNVIVKFNALLNYAAISGIEVDGAAVASSPTPQPVGTPTAPGGVPQWPAPGWVPYPKSPLTVPVAPHPTYTAGSEAIIDAMWAGRSYDPGRIQIYAGPPPPDANDYSQPLYFGKASDPQYTVSCYDFGGGCPAKGVVVHIPVGAYPAGGTDHHLSIRDTATGQDVMLWEAPVPSGNGGTYAVGWGTVISSNGDGLNAVGGSASGLSSLWALRATDLVHDTINHAIIVQINGESSHGFVYPAVGWDNAFFHSDPWPQMGAHFWLDVPPPYRASCPPYAVSYLTALNKYGAYFADNGGVTTPMEANFESDVEYTYDGGPSIWGPLMKSMAGNGIGTSNVEIDSCGIDMQQHMHVLNAPAPV